VDHRDHAVDQVAQAVGEFVVGAGDQRSTVTSVSPTRGTSRSSHQRTASAPYSAASAAGSQTGAPADLLIFRPPAVR
jgi:hypothetical protein